MPPRRRFTVSLVLTGDVAREIDGIRRGLGAAALERIAPHVTLVPPVNVREDRVDEACALVGEAAHDTAPLHLELGPPRSFFPAAPVVFLEVGGDLGPVGELRARLLDGPLVPPHGREERPFVPHVTLDQRIEPERIPAVLETLSAYRRAVTIEEVTILEFDEGQRRWAVLSQFRFERPRIVGRGGLEVELETGPRLAPAAARFQRAEWQGYLEASYGEGTPPDEPFAITARVGGEIVGTATGELRRDCCHLGILVVSPEWRSQGVGSHLMRAVERLATERGAPLVRLEVRRHGPAERFYRERGFLPVATLPSWREGHDFTLMMRHLRHAARPSPSEANHR